MLTIASVNVWKIMALAGFGVHRDYDAAQPLKSPACLFFRFQILFDRAKVIAYSAIEFSQAAQAFFHCAKTFPRFVRALFGDQAVVEIFPCVAVF